MDLGAPCWPAGTLSKGLGCRRRIPCMFQILRHDHLALPPSHETGRVIANGLGASAWLRAAELVDEPEEPLKWRFSFGMLFDRGSPPEHQRPAEPPPQPVREGASWPECEMLINPVDHQRDAIPAQESLQLAQRTPANPHPRARANLIEKPVGIAPLLRMKPRSRRFRISHAGSLIRSPSGASDVRGHVLWAYNVQHLDLLESYVAAPSPPNGSTAHRMISERRCCVGAMIYRVENDQPFRVIPYDSVQRAMWQPIGDITGPWSSFSTRFGITFTENDGRYEAPGPVAYAAVELPTGEQFPLEHHFDHQEIGVVARSSRWPRIKVGLSVWEGRYQRWPATCGNADLRLLVGLPVSDRTRP